MASFDTAYYKYIEPNEGGYANVAVDKGGETYAGIARNYHPSWSGWFYIDAKKKSGAIKNNTMFPDLKGPVYQFYLDWWNAKRFGEIKSQDIANFLFDYNVHSSSLAIKAVQRIVGVTADGAMGPMTVAAINKADPTKVYNALKEDRKKLFEAIVQRDPSQMTFWNGWMNRLKSFPDIVTPKNTLIVLAFVAVAVWAGYTMMTSKSMA